MSTSPQGPSTPTTSTGGGASIARSSAIMAAGTLVSRILGFVRNALLIMALGATASGAADAFNISNSLSTQLYNLLIGGILNAILVPQIVQALRRTNGEEIVNRLLTAASALLLVVSGILTAAAPLVILIYASGLGRWQPLAFAFAFWCMPQIFFYGLYALWGQVLNARHRFGPYMWSPVLNNIISIASLLVYLRVYGGYTSGQDPSVWTFNRIALIGATTTIGIAAQALVLYVPLVRSGFRPRVVWGVRGMGLGKASKVAMWALIGLLILGLGDLATINLGSRAVTAAQTARYADVIVPSTTMYANALLVYMLPQSLITTSIITALFTRMSEKAAAGDAEGVRDDLSLGLRSVAVFTVLFAAGIGTLAAPALQVFAPSISLAQAEATAPVLTVLAVGIIFQGVWFTTQRVMLAYSDTRRLLRADVVVGLIPVVICLGAYLLAPAQHWMTWAAVGAVLSHLGGTIAIIPLMRRHLPSLDGRRILSTYARLVLAALPAVLAGIGVRVLLGPADAARAGGRLTHALTIVIVAALVMTVVYLIAARLLRVSEMSVLFSRLSGIVGRIGRILPGGAGRAMERLAAAMAPAPAGPRSGRTPVSAPAGAPGAAPASAVAAPSSGEDGGALGALAGSANRRLGTQGTGRSTVPTSRGGVSTVSQGTPIGTGRYELVSPLPRTLPRIVRHAGRDTILDREVTVLTLGAATEHREDVLRAASRAVLIDDPRVQRVYDVEQGDEAFIVTEPASPRTLSSLVEEGLSPQQVRAVVGEVAQALDIASRRGLNHLHLSPDSVRLRPDGSVQVTGVGIEAAVLGLGASDEADPLAHDRADARALVELLYYGLTRRWPGKRSGVPAAPFRGDAPVAPSSLLEVGADEAGTADLDALVARTWGDQAPISAAEVARALAPWDTSTLPVTEEADPSVPVRPEGIAASALGVLGRLRGRSSAHAAPREARAQEPDGVLSPASGASAVVPPREGEETGEDVSSAPPAPAARAVRAARSAQAGPALAASSSAAPSGQARDLIAPSADEPEPDEEEPDEEDEVSRSVSRTTFVVLVSMILIVLVGVFFAVSNLLQLFGVRITDDDVPAAKTVPTVTAQATEQGGSGSEASQTPEAAPPAPIVLTGAESLDPYGDGSEHPELAATLIDGNPATSWYSRYYASPSLAFKQGIGLAVTLQQPADVSSIEIQGTGVGGHLQVRATSPEDPQGGALLAEGAFTEGTTSFSFPATSASSVVVWVTDLPKAADGLNKVTVSEITLR